MFGLLFGVGALAAVAGAVMIGFGIPVNEFSFGNTLIAAGTTAVVGGLIVIGLAMVVGQLQRIAEALASRTPIRSSRPLDMFEPLATAQPGPDRIPFPSKPKTGGVRTLQPEEPKLDLPPQPARMAEEAPSEDVAPALRNPDQPPLTVEDDVSLSPQQPLGTPTPVVELDEPAVRDDSPPPFAFNGFGTTEKQPEPKLDADWQSPTPKREPHTNYFDAMWPADSKPAKRPYDIEPKVEPKAEPMFDPMPADAFDAPKPAPMPEVENEPRKAAILKSGVVDGMGYTLYVDGSIEAELPDGILRFASITELREHLEKTP